MNLGLKWKTQFLQRNTEGLLCNLWKYGGPQWRKPRLFKALCPWDAQRTMPGQAAPDDGGEAPNGMGWKSVSLQVPERRRVRSGCKANRTRATLCEWGLSMLPKKLPGSFYGQGPLWPLGAWVPLPGGKHLTWEQGALVRWCSPFWNLLPLNKHNRLSHFLPFSLQPLLSPPCPLIFAGVYRRWIFEEDGWAFLSEICFRKAIGVVFLPCPPLHFPNVYT